MFFKKKNVPAEVKAVKLEKWYDKLEEPNKVILERYLANANTSSEFLFYKSIIDAALIDENYGFATLMCQYASDSKIDDYQRFKINECMIDSLIGESKYDDAKAICESNLSLYPSIATILIEENNGKIPNNLNFRNRYIDILVGVESEYDLANEMLDKYNEMGILTDDDLEYRKQSLKIRRLQKSFDSVYTYRPVGEDR
jgi:hypothetical protein